MSKSSLEPKLSGTFTIAIMNRETSFVRQGKTSSGGFRSTRKNTADQEQTSPTQSPKMSWLSKLRSPKQTSPQDPIYTATSSQLANLDLTGETSSSGLKSSTSKESLTAIPYSSTVPQHNGPIRAGILPTSSSNPRLDLANSTPYSGSSSPQSTLGRKSSFTTAPESSPPFGPQRTNTNEQQTTKLSKSFDDKPPYVPRQGSTDKGKKLGHMAARMQRVGREKKPASQTGINSQTPKLALKDQKYTAGGSENISEATVLAQSIWNSQLPVKDHFAAKQISASDKIRDGSNSVSGKQLGGKELGIKTNSPTVSTLKLETESTNYDYQETSPTIGDHTEGFDYSSPIEQESSRNVEDLVKETQSTEAVTPKKTTEYNVVELSQPIEAEIIHPIKDERQQSTKDEKLQSPESETPQHPKMEKVKPLKIEKAQPDKAIASASSTFNLKKAAKPSQTTTKPTTTIPTKSNVNSTTPYKTGPPAGPLGGLRPGAKRAPAKKRRVVKRPAAGWVTADKILDKKQEQTDQITQDSMMDRPLVPKPIRAKPPQKRPPRDRAREVAVRPPIRNPVAPPARTYAPKKFETTRSPVLVAPGTNMSWALKAAQAAASK